MHKYPRISFIIPARHEEHNLPHVLPRIPHFVSEVLLVDGHSTGATVEVARQVYPRIRMHTFRDGWRVFLTILKEKYIPPKPTSHAIPRTSCHALPIPPELVDTHVKH